MDPKEYRSLSQGRRSFSFLKSEQSGHVPYFEPTKAMNFGSCVHDILSGHVTKEQVESEIFPAAKSVAVQIKQVYFSQYWHLLEAETSYTAELHHAGLILPVMGRTDGELPRLATIDYKITSASTDKAFAGLIQHMHYDDQIWHYGNLAETPRRYILPYSTTRKCCLGLVSIPPTQRNNFWESAVINFGK